MESSIVLLLNIMGHHMLIDVKQVQQNIWQRESSGRVGGGEPEVNNLMYMKRRKDIYANMKHETSHRFHQIPKWNNYWW